MHSDYISVYHLFKCVLFIKVIFPIFCLDQTIHDDTSCMITVVSLDIQKFNSYTDCLPCCAKQIDDKHM